MKYHDDPRKKRRGPEIHTGGVQANVSRIMSKIEAGEKVVPLQKGEEKSVSTKPKVRFKLQRGVCSGCLRPLVRNSQGRTYHAVGVITKAETCKYAVIDYVVEPDAGMHSMRIRSGGVVKTVSFFSFLGIEPDPSLYAHDVPDWAFFSEDGEFL